MLITTIGSPVVRLRAYQLGNNVPGASVLKTLLKTARWAAVLYAACTVANNVARARDERRTGRVPSQETDRFDVEPCLDDDCDDDTTDRAANLSHGYVPTLTVVCDRRTTRSE